MGGDWLPGDVVVHVRSDCDAERLRELLSRERGWAYVYLEPPSVYCREELMPLVGRGWLAYLACKLRMQLSRATSVLTANSPKGRPGYTVTAVFHRPYRAQLWLNSKTVVRHGSLLGAYVDLDVYPPTEETKTVYIICFTSSGE